MRVRIAVLICLAMVMAQDLFAQSRGNPPDISGVWGPYRGGRGADPQLAPPPASPMLVKPEYAKPYEQRRATETAASSRGEPLAAPAVLCAAYHNPSMLSIAV